LLLPLLFRNSGGETANIAYIKKALAKSQLIFKLRSPRLPYQDWFL
jgi:hypothetical protein